jgi:hypothetical protein
MTFDDLVDRCKAEIRAERFFASLATKEPAHKDWIVSGYSFGEIVFLSICMGAYYLAS